MIPLFAELFSAENMFDYDVVSSLKYSTIKGVGNSNIASELL